MSLASKYYQKHVHGTYIRKRKTTRRAKRKRTERKIKQSNEKIRKDKQMCAQGAGWVSRGQGCCLLVRSVLLWFVELMDQRKDDTKRPNIRKTRQEEGRDTGLGCRTKTSSPLSSRYAKDDARDSTRGQRRRVKIRMQWNESFFLFLAQSVQNCRVRGHTIDLTGTGSHNKQMADCNTVRSSRWVSRLER